MKLSPEEKKRIYEEEKVRIEAQEKVKKEAEKAKAKKNNDNKLRCFKIIVISIIIALAIGGLTSCSKRVDLCASVDFTGTNFIITNIDEFDWTNVILRVNGKYVLKTQRIKSYKSYTVGAMQFAKVSDGTRFNPSTIKLQKISILCDTPEGDGCWYWYGE